MARLPRVVVADVPHHVTQRGNARQVIFSSDADRITYLELLREYSNLYGLSLLGYCLMSNHVHLIAVPQTLPALSQSLKQAHGRYAAYWNAHQSSSGHVWQGRFYSCPLDESHLWKALRYVELNPVRAGMVATAEQWRWSSAVAHCADSSPPDLDPMLEMERWRKRWSAAQWREFINDPESAADVSVLRHSTHTGRPLGSQDFVQALEELTSRPLAPRKGGRPRKPAADCRQPNLISAA
jgi:putative transposase